jgi:hypothetical protein
VLEDEDVATYFAIETFAKHIGISTSMAAAHLQQSMQQNALSTTLFSSLILF